MQEKPASLFVGRWQPFHPGHRALVESVLSQGKPVVIAIRDTEISHKNPYTVRERWDTIQKALHKWGELVKIVVIPDIDEVCYGRDVGYAIRRVELGEEVERAHSGTKTRALNPPTKDIVWLTGQTGAGKTSLALALKEKLPNLIILDGDEMRESISVGAGYSKEARDEHNLRVARLAKVLAKQGPVVVPVIAPFESTRKKIDALIKPLWVYVDRKGLPKDKQHPYEAPRRPHLRVHPVKETVHESADRVLAFLKKRGAEGWR